MPLEGYFLGRYRLVRLIGSGGMGEVYLAEDPGIQRQVAIKVIRTEIAAYPDAETARMATRLFQREAQAIARLDHPHILPLYDYGEQKIHDSVLTYLVMPYRPDGSLAQWLQHNNRAASLSLEDIAHFVRQSASALQYAHDHGIIHQDVKPTNFLVRLNEDHPNRPDLLLTDFGVAKLSTLTSSMSQSIRGTPAYMSPEQCQGHSVLASDQYALAVMTYELLTGRTPFRGRVMQMMYAHVHMQPQPPSSVNPHVPSALDPVILRGLAKKPEDRFPSIAAFAIAFQQAPQGTNTASPVMASSSDIATMQNVPSGADVHATLAISEDEARSGTVRALTLPDGRQVQVAIPAGAYDGQVVSVKDQGSSANGNYAAGAIYLTLSIVRTPQGSFVPAPRIDDKVHMHDVPPVQEHVMPIPVRSTPPYQREQRRRRSSTGVVTALLVLTLLIVLGGGGLFYYTDFNNRLHISATATAQAHFHANQGATATAAVQLTTTASSHATATAVAQSTATAVAQATASASMLQNISNGTPTFQDALAGNTNGWCPYPAQCNYGGGVLHLIDSGATGPSYVQASPQSVSLDLKDFAFTVRMKVLKGFGGGMIFRGTNGVDNQPDFYYYFLVGTNGSYEIDLRGTGNPPSQLLQHGTSTAIHTGIGQWNILSVVARGSKMDLYVNQQLVTSFNDSTYTHGTIGVLAYDSGHPNNPANPPVEVVFSNVKVWTLL